ncbi:MAG: FecR domain-containing protein [Tannerellaceae bacterium]|jgi:ferric-dicitrate binding protein FerR (iron transport regulator)|nr:FecR domain-containing protein [Tannerellaceae bacterium]
MDKRIIDYFNGELSEKERIELLREAEADPVFKQALLSCQNTQALFSLMPEAINVKAGEEGYLRLKQLKRKKKTKRFILMTTGYVAVGCMLVFVTWWTTISYRQQEKPVIVQQELFVPAGQRARIILPDGSVAWLNAGSTLSYPSMFENERNVFLTGEAYFDVAYNPDKPFIVSTDSINVQALGTQFDVYSYSKAECISAALIDGSIKVCKTGDKSKEIILKPNQQLFYKDGVFRVETFTDKDKLLWKEGIYSFNKESLAVIIKKLELYYDVEIIVKDQSILQHKYTGKFRQRDGVVEILQIIRKIHPFKIYKDEELNQITLSR